MSMDSKNTLLAINKLLLTNLLKFADLSQQQCSLTLSHHRNSLVGYIYRYDKKYNSTCRNNVDGKLFYYGNNYYFDNKQKSDNRR